tara:strand:+ start:333 stop:461 length:129 start_codon:yes stop_codon:yes gene_type:complete
MADLIVVMEDGRILESGAHDELVAGEFHSQNDNRECECAGSP